MNFFKSILSDDPDPMNDEQVDPDPNLNQSAENPNHSQSDSTANDDVWSFGGLFKTLSTRSESVLETYRRDLQEFGSGLKKETELFREVASRAVKDLPNSIEVGTTVTHAIDGVIKSTTEIISQGKESLLASSDAEPETPDANRILNSGRYSRFESQLMNIQSDPNTFCVDPEDLDEYRKWKSEFDLKEKSKQVDNLIGENGSLEGLYKRLVPNEVDHENFFCRYFYKVYKLMQQESFRAKLVNRAISIDDEELSWDVDDDDDDEQDESNAKSKVDDVKKLATDENESASQDSTKVAKEVPTNKSEPTKEDSTSVAEEVPTNTSKPAMEDSISVAEEDSTSKSEPSKEDTSTNVVKQTTHSDESKTLSSAGVDRKEEKQPIVDDGGKSQVVELIGNSNDSKKEDTEVVTCMGKKKDVVVKGPEGKGDRDESGKDGDVPIASKQQTGADEDDLDWAEIEDIEGNDEKKATSHVATSNTADLRKRLSVEEDDEDLSWDIEDDD